MSKASKFFGIASAFSALMIAPGVHAASNKVVIGDIDDMSGVYADIIGGCGIEAAKMAIADFGGSVLGQKIELLVSDHQNKPDLGAEKFRGVGGSRWAERWCLVAPIPASSLGD